MKDLSNKIVIVTGANGLIGKEIVHELEEHAATIIAADIAFETEVIDEKKSTFKLDLSDNTSIDSLVEFAMDNYGRIDGLINAAYPRTKDWGKYKFEDTPFTHWKKNVELQLNSVFYLDQ